MCQKMKWKLLHVVEKISLNWKKEEVLFIKKKHKKGDMFFKWLYLPAFQSQLSFSLTAGWASNIRLEEGKNESPI